MRNAEELVQIEVADVAAELTRCGADERTHVGAIDRPGRRRCNQLAKPLTCVRNTPWVLG
jgi:hypothetical protein